MFQPEHKSPGTLASTLVFLAALALAIARMAGQGWGAGLITPFRYSDAEYYIHYAWMLAFVDPTGGDLGHIIPPSPYVLIQATAYRLAGPHIWVPFATNALLFALAATATQRLAGHLFGRATGIVAGLLFILCGPLLFYAGLTMKTVAVVLWLSMSLLFLERSLSTGKSGYFALLSILVGILALERNNFMAALIALPLLTPLVSAGRRRLGAFLLLTVPAFAIFLGVQMLQTESNATSPLGINLYIGNAASATGAYVAVPGLRNDVVGHHTDTAWLIERETGEAPNEWQSQWYWIERTLNDMVDAPLKWLGLQGKKVLMLFARDVPGSPEQYSIDRWGDPVLAAAIVDYGLVLALAVPGIFLVLRSDTTLPVRILAAFPFVYALLVLPFFIIERYRFPILVGLIPFAAWTLVRFATSTTMRERIVLAATGIGIYVASHGLTGINPVGPGWPEDPQDKREWMKAQESSRTELYRLKTRAILEDNRHAWRYLSKHYRAARLYSDAQLFSLKTHGKAP